MTDAAASFADVVERFQPEILTDWMADLLQGMRQSAGRVGEGELRSQCAEFLGLLTEAARRSGGATDVRGGAWQGVRDLLAALSRSRGQQGFSPSETALFVLALRRPIAVRLRRTLAGDPEALHAATDFADGVIDALGLFTTEVYQRGREDVIRRQQQDMLELSTPVVKLWDGVLALPLIGTLDSARTQVVMESLLNRIVETGADIAIIDITGVPTVDTLTAQHLLKAVTAARLMGAECIISGIRPQIAQTVVHLGVDLHGVTTKATLADAFQLALQRIGVAIPRPARV